MSYQVAMLRQAEREFDRLPSEARSRIAPALRALSEEPRPHGSRRPKGRLEGLMRIRVGDWRVAYEVDDDKKTVCILEIARRSDVYRRAARRHRG